jgi:hypothetical protein
MRRGSGIASSAKSASGWIDFAGRGANRRANYERPNTLIAMERRRRIATYLMLVGLMGAGVILLAGFWNYTRASQRIDALVSGCKSTFQSSVAGADDLTKLCDPDGIRTCRFNEALDADSTRTGGTYSGPLFNVKLNATESNLIKRFAARIIAEADNRDGNWSNSKIGAFALVLICMLPRIWYFLLGRLAELATAVRGNGA